MSALFAAEKFWILDPLYAGFGTVLAWFYAVIPSFGVAIMLLTVTVSILRMPLVAKQVKSQQEMQRIQPELKRIQAKHKADPQKRNEELMKLYKEHNVNPFAGCLPLLLQMPLFIVLYRMILGLGRPEPKHIPRDSDLFQAVAEAGGEMQSFGMDLAQAASKVQGFGKLLPYLLVIGLVIATGMFQQRQMTARLPKDAVNTQMQIMGKIFPAFLGLISWSIPAGVVLYFFVSNLWQIGQQAVLFRRQEAKKALEGGATSTKKAGKGDDEAPADAKPGILKPGAGKVRAGGRSPTGGGGSAGGKGRSGKGAAGGGGKGAGKARSGANGKASGRAPAKTGQKGNRATDGRAGGGGGRPSASNGRNGGGGRAQAKGTSPQGRSRSGRGNSRKGK